MKPTTKHTRLTLGGLGLIAGLGLSAATQAQPAMLYIMDASGSMWGEVAGEPKISAAKSVLKDLIQNTPEHVDLGLLAYGHRRKGDCRDIELIAPTGSDRAALQQRIAVMNPRGRTPISDALLQAGKAVSGREDETSLVLVSDGLETCKGDPCAVARQLREQGHKLVIHVVGLDVDGKATRQLQCVAEAGGGRYFAAADAGDLRDALTRVKESVAEAKPIPAPPPPPKVEAGKSSSKRMLIAGPGKIQLKPASWVKMPPYYWALMDAESGEEKSRNKADLIRVKAGEYQIVWRQSQHGNSDIPLTAVAKVRSGKTSEVPLDTGLRITLPEGLKPPRWWGLADAGEKKPAFWSKTLGPQLMPAGDYHLLWRQDEHGASTADLGPISIESGKLNDLVLNQGLQLQPADWVPKKRPYYYRLIDDQGEIVAGWSIWGPQLAPVGEFKLVFRPSEHSHSEIPWGEVRIKADGIVNVALDSGIRFIPQEGAKPPYRVFFVNLDTKEELMMANTWDPQPLPPGRYRMDWWEVQHGSSRETLVDEFEVEAGLLLEMEI